MNKRIKTVLREWSYQSGLLGVAHRWRNRRTLTVFMFHRVLPTDSIEYAHAEKEFTFTVAGFGRALDFILRHYNVIPHAAIQAHKDNGTPLPPRAGLITFDDGWRDTLIHAAPELQKRGLPAVLFLATEVLELPTERWWQAQLVEALEVLGNLGRLEQELGIAADIQAHGERVRRLAAALAMQPAERRHALLDQVTSPRPLERQMLRPDEIPALMPAISVAGHGHTHAPLTYHATPSIDLSTCHARLQSMGCDAWAMSFPHGAYRSDTVVQARTVGFEVCYTSDAHLNDTVRGHVTRKPLGRIHVPENEWTCENGQITASKLATFLFFRPIAR